MGLITDPILTTIRNSWDASFGTKAKPLSDPGLFSVNPITTNAQASAIPPDLPYGDLVADYSALLKYKEGGGDDAKLLWRAFGIPETRAGAREAYSKNPELEKALRYYTVPDDSTLGKFIDTTYDVMPYVSGAVITGGLFYGIPAGGGLTWTSPYSAVEAAGELAPVTASPGVSLVDGPYLLEGPTTFPLIESGAEVAVATESTGFGGLWKAGVSGLFGIGKELFKESADTATEYLKGGIDKTISEEIASFFGASGGGGTGGGTYPVGGDYSPSGFLSSLFSSKTLPILLIILTLAGAFLFAGRK